MKHYDSLPGISIIREDPVVIAAPNDHRNMAEVAIDMFELLAVNSYNVEVEKDKNIRLRQKMPPVQGERVISSPMTNEELLLTVDSLIKKHAHETEILKNKSVTVYTHLVRNSFKRVRRGY